MKLKTLFLAGVLAMVFASTSMAALVGATYDFDTSTTGNTAIGATPGTYTDPANPGFCVGPPVECATGAGMSGSFSFADVLPTLSTITFFFAGSTDGAGPGTFVIDLSNCALPGGDTISSIAHFSGNIPGGDFTNVSWDGFTALFTGSTGTDYNAIGGQTVVFEVTLEQAEVPEPSSVWLLGPGLGFLLIGLRKRRHA